MSGDNLSEPGFYDLPCVRVSFCEQVTILGEPSETVQLNNSPRGLGAPRLRLAEMANLRSIRPDLAYVPLVMAEQKIRHNLVRARQVSRHQLQVALTGTGATMYPRRSVNPTMSRRNYQSIRWHPPRRWWGRL